MTIPFTWGHTGSVAKTTPVGAVVPAQGASPLAPKTTRDCTLHGGNVALRPLRPAGSSWDVEVGLETVEARRQESVALSTVHRWATSRGL